MKKSRDSTNLTYPHDLYRRFKEDEYLPLDERVVKVNKTCENRLTLARKGIFDEKKKEGTIVDKQLLEHNFELEQLHQKGHALMSNIKIACEQRQLEQREREKVHEEGILEHMQQKSVEVEEKLAKIHERWDKLKSRLDENPQKFLKTLKILKKEIQEFTRSKDDVVQTIKKDLTRINATYHSVLEKQDYDLHYLMQRVNNYLSNLKHCYVRQILKLDETINQYHQEEYERLYKCRHEFSTEIIVGLDTSEMLDNIDKKYQAEREYRAALQARFRELRIEYDEKTHAFRMLMEQDQESIEMELEETTSTYFLNSLKFNYNYQVLEKKNTDNVNQMVYEEKKKNWYKLVNYATNLRNQIKESKSDFKTKSFDITDHIEKFRDRLLKLESKAYNGAADNESKFQNILKMNLEEANNLITQICHFNKIFFEDHLGIRWESPDLQTLNHTDLEALHKSNKRPKDLNKQKEQNGTRNELVNEADNWKTLQLILKKMPFRMDYLLDKDLPEIMALCKLSENGNKLAQLDSVFSALGIEHLDALTELIRNFQLFEYCPQCEDEKIVEIHEPIIEPNVSTTCPLISNESAEKPSFHLNAAESVDNVSMDLNLMGRINDLNKIPKTSIVKEETVSLDHHIDINYAHILSALEMTIQSMKKGKLIETENDVKKNFVECFAIDFELRKNQIESLWKRYRQIFPEENVRTWSALEQGLSDYLIHLKKRFQLHSECERLRRQNAQLKYMLQELL